MTPPEAGAVTLASASAAWWIAAGAARRRGLALGWPPILAFAGITLLSALLPPHDVARAVVLGGIAVAAICDARTGLIFAPLTSALAMRSSTSRTTSPVESSSSARRYRLAARSNASAAAAMSAASSVWCAASLRSPAAA